MTKQKIEIEIDVPEGYELGYVGVRDFVESSSSGGFVDMRVHFNNIDAAADGWRYEWEKE